MSEVKHDNRRVCTRCGVRHWRDSGLCLRCAEAELAAVQYAGRDRSRALYVYGNQSDRTRDGVDVDDLDGVAGGE